MKRWFVAHRKIVTTALVVAVYTSSVSPVSAVAPVKMKNFAGKVDVSATGPTPFELAGTASHLGQFTARGEVHFLPVGQSGALLGAGVVVFEAANGDLLVGATTWEVGRAIGGERSTQLHFSWRDSVTFSDGTTVANTGRFVDSRPPGLVVIAIIAILIGLLLPAVQ